MQEDKITSCSGSAVVLVISDAVELAKQSGKLVTHLQCAPI